MELHVADLTENTKIYRKIHSVLLLICTDVKAPCKFCGRVFGCDSNPNFLSTFNLYIWVLFFSFVGVRWDSPLGTSTTIGLNYTIPGLLECGIRWNENWQGKPKYSEKTCTSATLSTTNSSCARTRAAVVGNRHLTAWAMARPLIWVSV
jgi:hypothetical protein